MLTLVKGIISIQKIIINHGKIPLVSFYFLCFLRTMFLLQGAHHSNIIWSFGVQRRKSNVPAKELDCDASYLVTRYCQVTVRFICFI